MKRHPSLQPFSRDHHACLVLARHLENEPSGQRLSEFLRVWNDEMEDHFFEEERVLLRFTTPEQNARLINEHMTIRQYATAATRGMLDAGDIVRLGGLITDHIRWEERRLFPSIEESASLEELNEIAAEAMELDQLRSASTHAPRRGELMSR
ncbi:MAG: hemerythrin domain-containing protein [Fimbriimonadales bacterium]